MKTDYEILQTVGEGWYGHILLVEHKKTRCEVVLKCVHQDATMKKDFFREFHYSYFLSPHKNILNSYDVAFQADEYYVFAQEYAPFGDLTSNISETGIGGTYTKSVITQISSALEFMHSKDLVHRDIKPDNILVFHSDFSKVKLCDFGCTRKSVSLVKKQTVWLPYAPPEICDTVYNEGYHVDPSSDVWQLAIMMYVCLTGTVPWQKADITDPRYNHFIKWQKRKSTRLPKNFTLFSTRLLRLFRRMLEPKSEKRCSVTEINKYLNDKWLIRAPTKRTESDNESICYSSHSEVTEHGDRKKMLKSLLQYGVETKVDKQAKKNRISEWVQMTEARNSK